MSGFKISGIDGLIYNPELDEYEIDEIYIKERKSKKSGSLDIEKTQKSPDIKFLSIWEKYLEGLDNAKIKKSTTYSSSYTRNESDESSISRTLDYSLTS